MIFRGAVLNEPLWRVGRNTGINTKPSHAESRFVQITEKVTVIEEAVHPEKCFFLCNSVLMGLRNLELVWRIKSLLASSSDSGSRAKISPQNILGVSGQFFDDSVIDVKLYQPCWSSAVILEFHLDRGQFWRNAVDRSTAAALCPRKRNIPKADVGQKDYWHFRGDRSTGSYSRSVRRNAGRFVGPAQIADLDEGGDGQNATEKRQEGREQIDRVALQSRPESIWREALIVYVGDVVLGLLIWRMRNKDRPRDASADDRQIGDDGTQLN